MPNVPTIQQFCFFGPKTQMPVLFIFLYKLVSDSNVQVGMMIHKNNTKENAYIFLEQVITECPSTQDAQGIQMYECAVMWDSLKSGIFLCFCFCCLVGEEKMEITQGNKAY